MDLDPDQLLNRKKSRRDRGPEVNPYYRLALTLVCLVAAGFVIVGGMNLAVYWFKCRHDHSDLKIGHCLYLSIPLVIGLLMLVRSPALARRLEQLFED
jgi:hypothetical protein